MVCLAFGGGPTARLNIPGSPAEMDQFLQVLSDVYLHQHHPRRIALVAYGEDGPGCVQALAALGEALVSGDGRGPEVGPVLWVNGEQWTDVFEGTRGTVDPGAHARMGAEFALLGRVMPVARREDLAAGMHGDPTAVDHLLPAAQTRISDMGVASRRTEVEWLGERIDQFGRDRELQSGRLDAGDLRAPYRTMGGNTYSLTSAFTERTSAPPDRRPAAAAVPIDTGVVSPLA